MTEAPSDAEMSQGLYPVQESPGDRLEWPKKHGS